MTLNLTNKRVCKFYQENPSISFEAVNIIFVDLFEKLLFNKSDIMNSAIHSQVLSSISENSTQISDLKQTISSLKDSVLNINTDMPSIMESKFIDIKKEYISDVKTIVQTNTFEKIGPLLQQYNSTLIDKTTILMSDIIPKNNNQINTQINDSIGAFSRSITNDTQQLIKSVDKDSMKEFINNFEMKSSMMLQNVQQPFYSFISASEERINSNINILKDGNINMQNAQAKFMSELGEVFNKFRENQPCERHNDKHLSGILTKMYNSAEVNNPSRSVQNTGLILLKRQRKSNVLINNKDMEENIGAEEVQQFLGSIDEQNCNGVFISQRTGISGKKNYQIEIHNNNIIVFVHNGNYDPAKIETAIDIIDQLAGRMRQFKHQTEEDCLIPKELLDAINNEYQLFLSQKNAVVDVFKESQKKVLSQIDEIRFPALDKYLSTKYSAPIQKPGLKCDLCKSFSANNLKALAAHKRGCIRKQPLTTKSQNNENIVNN
jgi:hypothetical protein